MSRPVPSNPGYRSEFDFMKFTDLSLPPELIAALAKQQISDPSPIQIAAIPPLAAGKDTYLRAETGTGKTLAYLLPLFMRIDPSQAAAPVGSHRRYKEIQRCADIAASHQHVRMIQPSHRLGGRVVGTNGWVAVNASSRPEIAHIDLDSDLPFCLE